MAIRNSAFLMSCDPAAADAGDAGWGSSDATGWTVANLGLDLGGDGLSSDMPPSRIGDIPPSNAEDPPPGRIVDVSSLEPEPSLARPLASPPHPPCGGSHRPSRVHHG